MHTPRYHGGMQWLGLFKRRRSPAAQLAAFFARYRGRSLILHAGLPVAWLEELLQQGGGGAHFRLDARTLPGDTRASPVEFFAREYLLPLELPLPILVKVDAERVAVRHLQRYGGLCHPSDIAWILDDIKERARVHACCIRKGNTVEVVRGIPVSDNAIETPDGMVI